MPETALSYPEKLEIVPLTRPPAAAVTVPGSKSITNRALVLAAMCCRGYESFLGNVLESEDSELMIQALGDLGFDIFGEPLLGGLRVGVFRSPPAIRPIPAAQAEL